MIWTKSLVEEIIPNSLSLGDNSQNHFFYIRTEFFSRLDNLMGK